MRTAENMLAITNCCHGDNEVVGGRCHDNADNRSVLQGGSLSQTFDYYLWRPVTSSLQLYVRKNDSPGICPK